MKTPDLLESALSNPGGGGMIPWRSWSQALATVADDHVQLSQAVVQTGHRLVWSTAVAAPAGPRVQMTIGRGAQRTALGPVCAGPAVLGLGDLRQRRVLDGRVAAVQALAVDAEERRMHLLTEMGEVHWDNADRWGEGVTQGAAQTTPGKMAPGLVVFDAAGGLIEAQGERVVRRREGREVPLFAHERDIVALALHPGGTVLYAADSEGIHGWDLMDHRPLGSWHLEQPVRHMACGPTELVTLTTGGVLRRHPLSRYRLEPGRQIGDVSGAQAVALGPAGEVVCAVGAAVEVRATGAEPQRIEGLVGTVVALAAVGQRLYVGGSAGVQILDLATGARLGQFCPLKEGGYLWSVGAWLWGSEAARGLVDVYQVDGAGREQAADPEARTAYLDNHIEWCQVQGQLYPHLAPDRAAEMRALESLQTALGGRRRRLALLSDLRSGPEAAP